MGKKLKSQKRSEWLRGVANEVGCAKKEGAVRTRLGQDDWPRAETTLKLARQLWARDEATHTLRVAEQSRMRWIPYSPQGFVLIIVNRAHSERIHTDIRTY